MDILVTNKTNISRKITSVVKRVSCSVIDSMFGEHSVSEIVYQLGGV